MKSTIAALLILSLAAQAFWTVAIEGRLYRCTDETGFGFLVPGDWYHPPYDWIAEAWTNQRIWILWIAMSAGVIAFSCVLGYFLSRRSRANAKSTGGGGGSSAALRPSP